MSGNLPCSLDICNLWTLIMKCSCSGPGFCPTFNKHMNVREYQICSQTCPHSNPCDLMECEKMRQLWLQWKNNDNLAPIKKANVHPPDSGTLLTRFTLAMKAELAWRARGGRAPTAEEKADRRVKCNACTLYHDDVKDKCKICGCFLEAGLLPPRPLGKLDCATQRCPLGLWETVGGFKSKGCGGAGGLLSEENTKDLIGYSGTVSSASESVQLPNLEGSPTANTPPTSG